MSTFRPLPPRPNLEHARKEAKALLRRLRGRDAEALDLVRKRHPAGNGVDPAVLQLADAQLITARDYGFASWPRLVRYFEDVNRQQDGLNQLHGGLKSFESDARRLTKNSAADTPWATRVLAAFVPRFYGLQAEEIQGERVTEEEARLAVARMNGAPSWEVLLQRIAHDERNKPPRTELWEDDHSRDAWKAIRAGDLDALKSIVAGRPELLDPSEMERSSGNTLMAIALGKERRDGADAARPIIEWLEEQGFDRQRELDHKLSRSAPWTRVDELRALVDQGADPSAADPGGTPLFEITLLRYRDPEAIAFLAARVKPRRALWISAALGDIEALASFFGPDGRLLPDAGKFRPDWIAAGRGGSVTAPFPSDHDLLAEALYVAMTQAREEVIDFLVRRGAPLTSPFDGQPLLSLAIANGMTAAAETLILAGASLDARDYPQGWSPREAVHQRLMESPHDPGLRRIGALCGLDADALTADLVAASKDPQPAPEVTQAIEAAVYDAARIGSPAVTPENLLMGLLRTSPAIVSMLKMMNFEVARFRADHLERLSEGTMLRGLKKRPPLDKVARAVVDAAGAVAREKMRGAVTNRHLLTALIDQVESPAELLLREYGVDTSIFRGDYRGMLI